MYMDFLKRRPAGFQMGTWKHNLLPAKRGLRLWSLSVLIVLLIPAVLHAESLHIRAKSAIVMDMNDGRILFSKNPDQPMQPASITKVLSLYLVYEAMREVKVHPDDLVTISRKAGTTGGSRMRVRPGWQVPLEELIKGMAIASGNDASVAVAEYLAGDVDTFVDRMNRKAQQLEMVHSRFINPNGLPAKGQFTTARDILKLSQAYLRDFPESLSIHALPSFTFAGITRRNHNRLLIRCPDVDGLKTGYVCASGYHIVATAKRGDTRLIAVVMGSRSPGIRDRETKRLLDEGFRMTERAAFATRNRKG